MFSFRRDSKEKNSENNKTRSKNMKNKKPESRSTKLNVIDDEVGKPTLYSFSYRLMSKRVGFMYLRFTNLNSKLEQSMMLVPFEAYISTMAFLSMIGGFVGVIAGIITMFLVNVDPAEFKILFPFIGGMSFSLLILGLVYLYPGMNVKSRKSKIGEELPYFIGYMATLAASGLSLENIFKTIAKEESKEELVKDAKFTMRNMEILGVDITTAIKLMIKRSPHISYTELLEGLIATIQSGGDLREYFLSTAKVQMEEKKRSLQKVIASLGVVAEMYTVLLVVFPLMGIIILSIMAIMVPTLGGLSLSSLMYLLTFLMVPLFGIMMLVMIDSMVPKR